MFCEVFGEKFASFFWGGQKRVRVRIRVREKKRKKRKIL